MKKINHKRNDIFICHILCDIFEPNMAVLALQQC